ncbi:SLOG family protein [Actinophytocola sediminis]
MSATRCLTAANLSSREERAAGQNRSGDAERAHTDPTGHIPAGSQPFVVVEDVVTRRILITGSRNWNHRPTIRAALVQVWRPSAILVSGACPRGADALCEACWEHWGGRVERHPAQWRTRGVLDRSAGFRRNEAMIALGADVCLAFILDDPPARPTPRPWRARH